MNGCAGHCTCCRREPHRALGRPKEGLCLSLRDGKRNPTALPAMRLVRHSSRVGRIWDLPLWGDGHLMGGSPGVAARLKGCYWRRIHQVSETMPTWIRRCGILPVPCILTHHAPMLLGVVVAIVAVFGEPCHCPRGGGHRSWAANRVKSCSNTTPVRTRSMPASKARGAYSRGRRVAHGRGDDAAWR